MSHPDLDRLTAWVHGVGDAEVQTHVGGCPECRDTAAGLREEAALLSREIYADAGHLHGDSGARVLMASHPGWVEEAAIDRPVPRDVDTRDDLEP